MKHVVATEVWPWHQWCARRGVELWSVLPEVFRRVTDAGVFAWEANIRSEDKFLKEAAEAARFGITLPTAYADGELHTDSAPREIERLLRIASVAREHGVAQLLVNPACKPAHARKTNDELAAQAVAMNQLGKAVRGLGVSLVYHYHTHEFAEERREFSAMMANTRPENVRLCLDVHWAYRGCGDRMDGVNEMMTRHADRVALVHLRQSRRGIIHEVFEDGDIDYRPIFRFLVRRDEPVPLVLECGLDDHTPITRDTGDALRESRRYLERLLAEEVR